MIRTLLGHNFKRIRRSPDLQRNVASNVVLGIILLTFFLNILGLGLFLDRMLAASAPGRDPVAVLNGVLLYYLLADLAVRFFLQKIHTLSAKPYLVLPVRRRSLVHTLLVKSLFSWFNVAPLLIIVPAVFTVVSRSYSGAATAAWFFSLVLLMFANSYVNNYLRNRFLTNPVAVSGILVVLLGLLALERYRVVSFTEVSAGLFQSILEQPYLVLVPLALVVLTYLANLSFVSRHIYLDEVSNIQRRHSTGETFSLMHRFGRAGKFIDLEMKMLLRNKRARSIPFFSFLMLFYGFFAYPIPMFAKMDFVLILVGMLVIGMFVYSYTVFVFSWESGYFGAIVTKQVDIREYLRAKYMFLVAVTSAAYVASLLYGFYGFRIVLVNTTLFLFTLGVGVFLMLYLATFNRMKFDLGANVFSQQGKTSLHFTAFLIAMAVHGTVFLPFRILFGSDGAYVALGALGLSGMLLHRLLIDLIARQFQRRKHVMVAGFRTT